MFQDEGRIHSVEALVAVKAYGLTYTSCQESGKSRGLFRRLTAEMGADEKAIIRLLKGKAAYCGPLPDGTDAPRSALRMDPRKVQYTGDLADTVIVRNDLIEAE